LIRDIDLYLNATRSQRRVGAACKKITDRIILFPSSETGMTDTRISHQIVEPGIIRPRRASGPLKALCISFTELKHVEASMTTTRTA
jgi:hypothetical protein